MSLLELKNIGKTFGKVRALKGVSLSLDTGEIVGLVGENGAGKSTLIKVLGGVHTTYEGQIILDGELVRFRSTMEAQLAGIHIVHQELALADNLTVQENIFLGNEISRAGVLQEHSMRCQVEKVLEQLELKFSPDTKVAELSIADQQMVEIARGLVHKRRIIVLDEPTTALSPAEVKILFRVLREDLGVGILYISHRLDEISELTNRVVVMRDGEVVTTHVTADVNHDQLIADMVGRQMSDRFPTKLAPPDKDTTPLLSVRALRQNINGKHLQDINLDVYPGEIVGLAGLVGAGRSELATSLFGGMTRETSGRVELSGQPFFPRNPHEAMTKGVAFVTENRKQTGLSLEDSVVNNLALAALPRFSRLGVINQRAVNALADKYKLSFRIKTPSTETVIRNLSGGNQQKVVLAKWLATDPKLLILDEPTRGVDVGARYEIYELIMQHVAERGLGVLLISSDLEEIFGVCHRVVVMREGRVAGSSDISATDQHGVMSLATGSL